MRAGRRRWSRKFAQPYMQALREFLVREKARGKRFSPKARIFPRAGSDAARQCPRRDPRAGPLSWRRAGAWPVFFGAPRRAHPAIADQHLQGAGARPWHRPAKHGFLEHWADQGVLLLNSVLTVERGMAASHQGQGWERFTDAVIRAVNGQDAPVVFMLWGAYAQRKAAFVDASKHLVLKAPHPSPLSAHQGFIGCGHFSRANAFLAENGLDEIDWRLGE